MTGQITPATAGRAELDAALLLLSRMGITPNDLLAAGPTQPPAPTFAEYIPVVAAAVSTSSRRAYNLLLEQGPRTLGRAEVGRAHRRRCCWTSSPPLNEPYGTRR